MLIKEPYKIKRLLNIAKLLYHINKVLRFIYPGQFIQISVDWLLKLICLEKLKSGCMLTTSGYAQYKLAFGPVKIKYSCCLTYCQFEQGG